MRVPEGLTLHPFQIDGVKHLLAGGHRLLLDDMGLGKTAQSIVAANSLGARRILVLAPSSTRWGWELEVHKWSVKRHLTQVLVGTKDSVCELSSVVICSYSLLMSPKIKHELLSNRWSVIIIDEVHKLKNPKAKSARFVYKELVKKCSLVFGLSGTIMTNSPADLYNPLRSLRPDILGSYSNWLYFIRRYCAAFRMGMRWVYTGSSNTEELHKKLFATGFALRRTKKQVLQELPDKIINVVPTKNTSAFDWDAADAEMIKNFGNKTASDLSMAEVRKNEGVTKIPDILEYIGDTVENQVVVFTWHREVTEALHKAIPESVAWYGGVTEAKKRQALDAFIQGKSKVFIANISSAGTGLDGLQKVCSRCIFAELPWTYTEMMQAADRLHRIGQRNAVQVDLIVDLKGVDGYVLAAVYKKESVFKATLDGLAIQR